VRQVVLNLLSNAVKFTDSGGINVHVALVSAGGGPACGPIRVRLSVKDTGIGLSADDMKALFSEFEQSDAAVRRRHGGTGLGLAISKRIARAMDGDITVESSPGNGSTFNFEFNAKCVSPSEAVEAVAIDRATAPRGVVRVLLAISPPFERSMIATVLEQAGIACSAVEPDAGMAAIETAIDGGVPFDCLIVEASGNADPAGRLLAAMRRGCGRERSRGLVMVNVLSRAGLAGYREAGFDAFLVRPVRPTALLQQLDAGSGHPTSRTAVPRMPAAGRCPVPVSTGTDGRPRRVLLAEDNEINALLARRIIESLGCEVDWVRDGQSAIDRAQTWISDGVTPPDLLLMDIFMPNVDGIEAAQRIKALLAASEGSTRRCPPIVALTANAFPEDRARYRAAGMDDYLAKPFDRAALEALMVRWLERPRANAHHPAEPAA
jgi:CheY-like chemotaxis protein